MQCASRNYSTRSQAQALTIGGRNKLAVKTSLKSTVKCFKVKSQGEISLGQDFDRGRSSPYSTCLGDTPGKCDAHLEVRSQSPAEARLDALDALCELIIFTSIINCINVKCHKLSVK